MRIAPLLIVASHAAYNDDLQEKVADAESIGGAMLESIGTTDVDTIDRRF